MNFQASLRSCITHVLGALLAGLLLLTVELQGSLRVDQDLIKAQILLVTLGAMLASSYSGNERRRTQFLCVWALIGLTVSAFWLENRRDLNRFYGQHKITRIWNVFHYYLGAKYFDELGYEDLYNCIYFAEAELGSRFHNHVTVRDLTTLGMISRGEAVVRGRRCVEERFTEERWKDFHRDWRVLRKHASTNKWSRMLQDRGYNPTPFWTVIGTQLANAVDLSDFPQILWMGSLDWILIALTFVVLAWAFGITMALACSILFTIHFVNDDRLIGGILQYDWWCAIMASMAFFHRRKMMLSGGLMAYATCARVFPGFLFLGPLLLYVVQFYHSRFYFTHCRPGAFSGQFLRRFILSFVVSCAVLFMVGCGTARGVGAWNDFRAKISTHSGNQIYSARRIGLKMAFAHNYSVYERPHGEEKVDVFKAQRLQFFLVALSISTVAALACTRTQGVHIFIPALSFIFAPLILSRYYWSILVIMVLAIRRDAKPILRIAVALALAIVFIGHYLYEAFAESPYHSFLCVNLALCVLLPMLSVICIRSNDSITSQESPTTSLNLSGV